MLRHLIEPRVNGSIKYINLYNEYCRDTNFCLMFILTEVGNLSRCKIECIPLTVVYDFGSNIDPFIMGSCALQKSMGYDKFEKENSS